MFNDLTVKQISLPQTIPVFPLPGVLLLPGIELPLNIFEEKYINLVDDALAEKKLIGIAQPKNGLLNRIAKNKPLYEIGCLGKIKAYNETDDGRYLIVLSGITRFEKIEESTTTRGYRRFKVDYNKFEDDGVTLDQERRLDVFAVDLNTTIKKTGTYIVGEAVWVMVDVPSTYTQQYGSKQQGAFIDVVQPILKRKMFDWDDAVLNLSARLDYVDWNVGEFNETKTDIGDYLWAITPAISFRPSAQTVFRLNYRYQWQTDILNNPPARMAAWMFGFSTYF